MGLGIKGEKNNFQIPGLELKKENVKRKTTKKKGGKKREILIS
jgi:hypothetical protein